MILLFAEWRDNLERSHRWVRCWSSLTDRVERHWCVHRDGTSRVLSRHCVHSPSSIHCLYGKRWDFPYLQHRWMSHRRETRKQLSIVAEHRGRSDERKRWKGRSIISMVYFFEFRLVDIVSKDSDWFHQITEENKIIFDLQLQTIDMAKVLSQWNQFVCLCREFIQPNLG